MNAKFEVGRSYACRSMGNWDCIFTFEIVRRSAKTVTIRSFDGEHRRAIRHHRDSGDEMIAPLGSYSMSPLLTATDFAENV